MISAQPFGRQMPLSWIPETLLKLFHYQGAKDLIPSHTGLFEGTPVSLFDLLHQTKTNLIDADC